MEHRARIEPLEDRIAPAGLVTVTLAAGTLNLAGDAAANDLTVEATAPGVLALTGNNGTMITFDGTTAASVTVEDPVSALTGDLGGDSDVLVLNYLNLAKGITLSDLSGATNDYTLRGLRLGGALSVTGGAGKDLVNLTGETFTSKAVTLTLGDGENVVAWTATEGTTGAFNLTTGADVDTFTKNQGDWEIGGPLTANLGAGANNLDFTGGSLVVTGAVNIQHGTHATGTATTNLSQHSAGYKSGVTISYVDGTNTTTINASYDVTIKGLLKVNGGSGNDSVTLAGSIATLAAGINMSGGTGTNSLTLSPSVVTVKGLTYTGGSDADNVNFNGSYATFTGPVAVTLGDGANTFSANVGVQTYNAGLNVTGGNGIDNVYVYGNAIFSSIKLQLAGDNDVFYASGTNITVNGMADFGFGEGNNSTSVGFSVANFNGGWKVTAGAGDDSLSFGANAMRLPKGVMMDGGNGNNTLALSGGVLDASGDLVFKNGSHSGGTSSADVSFSRISLQKSVNAKFGDGMDFFRISGGGSVFIKGGVTVSAPGTGASDIDLNGQSFTVLGKLAVTGGSDGLNLTTSTSLLNLAAVQVNGGAGVDTVNINADGQIAALTLALGAGGSNVALGGQHGGLTVKGALNILTPSVASGDSDNLTLANLTLLGAAKIMQGAGTGGVNISDIVAAAAFTLDTAAGNDTINIETTDSGIVSLFKGAVGILLGSGTNNLTIGNNAALAKADFRSTVKIVGGSETDTFNDNGNLYITGQPVTQNIP